MRLPGVDHAADDVQHLQLFRPPVDQVPDEHRLPTLRRAPATVPLHVAHAGQQCTQLAALAVHITDHVEHRRSFVANHH